jgi:hypothetical protein
MTKFVILIEDKGHLLAQKPELISFAAILIGNILLQARNVEQGTR